MISRPVITQDFLCSEEPTWAKAKAGVKAVDIHSGTVWQQNQIPDGVKWVVIATGVIFNSGVIQSVTGLNTDNSDPLNPIIQISADGVTITGDGTPGNPLVAAGGGSVLSDGRTIDGDGTLGNELEVINYDLIWSAGSLTGFGITDNGDGTVDIDAGTGVLRNAATQSATLYEVSIGATASLALTDNSVNYIYIDYNAGVPQVGVTTLVTGFNCMDKCIIYKIVRQGTVLQWLFAGENNVDGNRKLRRRFYETQPIIRGVNTAVASSAAIRYLQVTDGIFWYALTRITTTAIDTSVADTFQQVYNTGGSTFNTSSQTQINNSQYNTGGALAAMTGNKYRADDIYMMCDSPSVVYVVIGTAQYNSYTDALTSPKISAIPLELQHLGVRIARAVIQNGATSAVVSEISPDEITASGDVVGTGISVDGNFPVYSGTTGKVIVDSGYAPADFQPILDIVNVTGDDTLALTDAWKALVIDDTGGTVEITVPDNATVAFPIGTEIRLLAATTESIDIIADTGVTINSLNGYLSLADQFAEATLVKTGTDEWYLYGDLRKTMDADAAALVAAIGTLTEAEITAIDDWFVAAKANGYYTKLKVVTGHCLGSASNNKWNWLNPVDSNAAFRAVYYGSPTVNARSMIFNGTSQYFRNLWDTAVNIFSTPYSTSVIQCFRSNTASNGASFGFVNGSHIWTILPKYGGTLFSDCYNQAANRMSVANADATGIYIQTRTSSTVHKVFKDGTQIGGTDTAAATNWASLTAEPYWMCWNNGGPGVYFNGEPWLTACGDGLTDSDAANLTNDLQTLKTALGI